MHEGLDELEAVIGHRPTAIAYPHAKADVRIAAAAQLAGFEIGLVCRHGRASDHQHPLLLDRVNALIESPGRFALGLARISVGD